MNYQNLDKIALHDLIVRKTSYISSLVNLVMIADKTDEDAELDAVFLCDELARDIKEMVDVMLRK